MKDNQSYTGPLQSVIVTSPRRRVFSGFTWSLSGILVIVVRVFVSRSATSIPWFVIGGGMIAYGSGRLIMAYLKARVPITETPEK